MKLRNENRSFLEFGEIASEQGAAHFAAVHKVFGASNVSKLLLHIPVHKRLDAVVTICYEAQARLRDPVFGCVAHIFALQQQVVNLQAELSYLQGHLATLELPPPPAQPQQIMAPPSLTIADLPTAGSSSVPATYDLSSLFDHPVLVQHPPPQWTMQPPRQMDSHHQFGAGGTRAPTAEASSGDLQELARELLHRQGSSSSTVPCNNMAASTLPPHSSK
ncbi:hypothetical protein ACH5RR_000303 [Cinchona calisaya]|uniref:LOB domain-containing protein n=1 Tax=Cinchona calisaya TaxID=153742 RepID=A0ABD3B187_9GENT